MPFPKLHIDDPARGLPRQPICLRYAFLITGLEYEPFLNLFFCWRDENDRCYPVYEYVEGKTPGVVRWRYFHDLWLANQEYGEELDLFEHLPKNFFVWSDDLANAFSTYMRFESEKLNLHYAQIEEDGVSLGPLITFEELNWNPALLGMNQRIDECVDLSGLSEQSADLSSENPVVALSTRELGKRETQARYERWRSACDELKARHPDKTWSWIACMIAKMPIAEGKDWETIRKIMRRK